MLPTESEYKITQRLTSRWLHTTTFPGRVLPHSVVDKVVVQKWQVIVESYWPTASLRGRVSGRKSPVVSEVVKDFVIVGQGLSARSRAVPEYHFLARAVAQTKVRNIEVDLFEHTAPSSNITSSSPHLTPRLPLSSSSCPTFTTLLARSFLLLPSSSSPAAQVLFGRGRGGGWRHGGWGGSLYSTYGHFDEVYHILKLI